MDGGGAGEKAAKVSAWFDYVLFRLEDAPGEFGKEQFMLRSVTSVPERTDRIEASLGHSLAGVLLHTSRVNRSGPHWEAS